MGRSATGTSRVQNALVFTAGIIFVVLALEITFRLLNIFPSIQSPPRHLLQKDDVLGYRLSSEGHWLLASTEFKVDIQTNSQGFRGQEWHQNLPFVYVLGSSEVFGWGVGQKDIFSSRISQHLSDARLPLRARNLSVFGYNSRQIETVFKIWQNQLM